MLHQFGREEGPVSSQVYRMSLAVLLPEAYSKLLANLPHDCMSLLNPGGTLFNNRRINFFDVLQNPLIFLGLVKRPDRNGADPSSQCIMGLEDEYARIGPQGQDVNGLEAGDAGTYHNIVKYIRGLRDCLGDEL